LILKIKTDKISSSLLKKGFVVRESHHKYYILFVDGKKTSIRTRISHGSKEYGVNLLSAMRKQLKLNYMDELTDLINCPMSMSDYVQLLIERGQIDR